MTKRYGIGLNAILSFDKEKDRETFISELKKLMQTSGFISHKTICRLFPIVQMVDETGTFEPDYRPDNNNMKDVELTAEAKQ